MLGFQFLALGLGIWWLIRLRRCGRWYMTRQVNRQEGRTFN